MTQEYNIPEGYEARIEGNKVIIAQKESEDERIRNLIRRIVISTNDGDLQCLGDDDTKKCLAWLEKQKDQKPAEKYAIPEIKVSEDVSVTSRMKYIPEQLKPIADFILDYASWNLHKDEWNHPVAEVPLFRVLDALAQGGKPYCESGCVKQKPAEWSEEDEQHFDSIIESYKELIKDYSANHGVDYIPYNTPVVARTVVNDIKFLKSLRPQPHWKPSEEQMRALWEIYQGGKAQAPIASLYEDLKKLQKEQQMNCGKTEKKQIVETEGIKGNLEEIPSNVDLEKEIEDYINGCLGGLEGQEIAACAKYFYELGLKARKEK